MNVSYKEAVMRLNSQMEQGDCIIRPSSKGADHLTCSWKIHDGVTGHIDIKEDDKINNYTLGKRLFIGNEVSFGFFFYEICLKYDCIYMNMFFSFF